MARFSDTYIDCLLASGKYDALVELQSIFWCWPGLASDQPRYGLPPTVFTFVETLNWFSQAIRSGAWTYFEVTPNERQMSMFAALQRIGPPKFADQYQFGIEHWRAQEKMRDLDRWISDNESICDQWLFDLLRQNRKELGALYA